MEKLHQYDIIRSCMYHSHPGPFFNMLEFVGNVLNPSVQPYLFSPYIGERKTIYVDILLHHGLYYIVE